MELTLFGELSLIEKAALIKTFSNVSESKWYIVNGKLLI